MNLNTLPLFPTVLGIDIETNNELDRFKAKIMAVGLSDGKETWILTEKFDRLIYILENPNVLKIIHNADFDLTTLCYRFKRDYNLDIKPANIYDTLIVERNLNNGLTIANNLSDTLARRLGVMLDKSMQQSFINEDFTQEQLEYLENDCRYLPALREEQLKEVAAYDMQRIVELENKDILVTLDKTLTGIGIDLNEFEAIRAQVPIVLDQIVDQITEIVGEDFVVDVERHRKDGDSIEKIGVRDLKWNAWQQLKPALHQVGVKVKNTTKQTLEDRVDQHPIVQLVLDYKEWFKMLGWRWDEFVNPETGRIHPSWNQLGTITGRFSSSNPNMQQVPRKTRDDRPNFRALFRPLPGHVLVIADWSQQEPRILAHVAQDQRMIEAANSSDIYCAFGKDVWGETITKGDPRRQQMKVGVLASFYGVWYKNLALRMNLSEKEAERTQNNIFKTYRAAKMWGDYQIKAVMKHGYTQSVWGRRIYFENLSPKMKWKIAKDARNYPIQATGADMAKLAEVKIYDIIQEKNYDAHFIIGLHDELVISCAKDQAEEFFKDMTQAMMDAGSEICPSVKFPVEGTISDIWEH